MKVPAFGKLRIDQESCTSRTATIRLKGHRQLDVSKCRWFYTEEPGRTIGSWDNTLLSIARNIEEDRRFAGRIPLFAARIPMLGWKTRGRKLVFTEKIDALGRDPDGIVVPVRDIKAVEPMDPEAERTLRAIEMRRVELIFNLRKLLESEVEPEAVREVEKMFSDGSASSGGSVAADNG